MKRLARISTAFLAIFALLAETMVPALAQIAPPAQAEARFAFVIGNDGYEGAPLPSAANDAGLVAETLRSAGFDITGARNLDQDTLRASYREFIDKVAAAGPNAVAAVYLSGYGLQVEGENYLVPVGARVQRDTDVSLNAIRISDLTRALGGQPGRAQLVMLDLAYDGPFGKQGQPLAPGLAIVEPELNAVIGFNTAPGAYAPIPKGDYGPYAQAISETFRIAGLPVDDIFARVRTRTAELSKSAQIPWNASRIDPNFQLMERAPDAPALPVSPAQRQESRSRPMQDFTEADAYAAALDRDTIQAYQDFLAVYPRSPYAKTVRGLLAARREALTWRRSAVANTPNAYWSYLDRYPRGPHAPDARRRLARLGAPLQAPSSFDALFYDEAPPPSSESFYFEGRSPYYFDDDALPPPRLSYMPPPPAWWAPPPPPPRDLYRDEIYFLPTPYEPPPPSWVRPPAYVAEPPRHESGGSILPYVAIPAALAAGIVAGKIISDRRRDAGGGGEQRPPGGPGGFGGQAPVGQPPVGQAPAARPFMPPVATPPRPMTQIIQQQGQVSQPVAPLVQPAQPRPAAPTAPAPLPGAGTPPPAGAPPRPAQPGLPPASAPAPGAAPQIQQQQAPLPGQPRPPGQPGGQALPPPPGAGAPPPAGALPRPPQPGLPAPGAAPQSQQQPAPLPGQPRPPGQPGAPAPAPIPGAGTPPPPAPAGALPRPAQPGLPPPGAAPQAQQPQAITPGQLRPLAQPAPQSPQPPAQPQPLRQPPQAPPPQAPAPAVQQPRPIAPPPAQPAPPPPAQQQQQQQQMLQRQQQEQQQRAQEQQRAQQQQMQQQQQQAEQQRRAQEQQRAQQQMQQQQAEQQRRAQEQQRAQQQQMQQQQMQQQQQRAMEQQRAQQAAEQQRRAQEQQRAKPLNCGNPGQPACPR